MSPVSPSSPSLAPGLTPEAVSATGPAARPAVDDFLSRFASKFPDARPGRQIAERAVQLVRSQVAAGAATGDAPNQSVDPAMLVVRIHKRLRVMGDAHQALVSRVAGLEVSNPVRTNSDYAETHLNRAREAASAALTVINPDDDAALIQEKLEPAERETSAQEKLFDGKISRAYAPETENGGKLTLNVTTPVASVLPSPVNQALARAADWLASKIKDHVVARVIAQVITAIALTVIWAAPLVLGAVSIALPPLALLTLPLAGLAALAIPVLSGFFEHFWAALGAAPEPPATAVILVGNPS